MGDKQTNVRLPQSTLNQIEVLKRRLGMTTTQVFMMAIHELFRTIVKSQLEDELKNER